MTDYSSRSLSPDTLCGSKHPLISKFHEYLCRNGSMIDEEFSEFFPFLTICKPITNFELAPPILLMGKKCDQRKLFEAHYGRNAFKSGRTPDLELERLSAFGYEYALENGCFCQECEAIVDFPDGPVFVPFVRYIARYKEPGGKTLIAYAANLLDRTLQ